METAGFDPNSVGNPNNNIFGLPTNETDAGLVILPVPWEVTVSYRAGTSRSPDHILSASLQVDLYDPDFPEMWKLGYYMRPTDKKILIKSDYLRKEAELYINFIAQGECIDSHKFMTKTLREINEGGFFLNNWVYEQTSALLQKGKLVGLLGGDHSTPYGFFKAIGEKYQQFGILQIDAHCDLRQSFEGFHYSHASVMYNTIMEIPAVSRLVQVGIRDYCDEEAAFIQSHANRIQPFFDRDMKRRQFDGESWKNITNEIIAALPEHVFISFDIDGLDPKLCPNTGTPVPGGLELEQVFYLFHQLHHAGKKIIGFDLNEVGVSSNEWDENVGARALYKLCNLLAASHASQG